MKFYYFKVDEFKHVFFKIKLKNVGNENRYLDFVIVYGESNKKKCDDSKVIFSKSNWKMLVANYFFWHCDKKI